MSQTSRLNVSLRFEEKKKELLTENEVEESQSQISDRGDEAGSSGEDGFEGREGGIEDGFDDVEEGGEEVVEGVGYGGHCFCLGFFLFCDRAVMILDLG